MSKITITFKTITQVTFTETFDTTQTIADVKKKIADERGSDFAVDLQKLIYNGKILEDATTVGDVGLDPNKFVVVMLARKKAPVTEPTPAAAAAPPAEIAPTPAPAAAPAAPAAAPAADLTAEQTDKLDNVLGMGYTREQALRALTLADWDANRAVNLLLSGSDDFDAGAGVVGGPGAAAPAELDEDLDESGAADINDLAAMPQFEELRNLIRSNPAALPELMREIAQSNPALMNAISQNQGAFLQMMSGGSGAQEGGASGAGGTGGGAQPTQHTIRLTAEEAEAIQRIKSMGLNVPDQLIIEAYLACDKNEELAVSYIMDAMDQFQD